MVCLAAGDNEEAIWGQLLVVVVLAAAWGTYSLARKRAKRLPGRGKFSGLAGVVRTAAGRWLGGIIQHRVSTVNNMPIKVAVEQPSAVQRRRDLAGGIELLARDFLVGVIENTDAVDQREVAMRSMCFDELVRRGELWSVASVALKVYVLDNDGLFSKSIHCEAMKELAGRTGKTPDPKDAEITVYGAGLGQSQALAGQES